jgi:hypothetical protein
MVMEILGMEILGMEISGMEMLEAARHSMDRIEVHGKHLVNWK